MTTKFVEAGDHSPVDVRAWARVLPEDHRDAVKEALAAEQQKHES